MHRPNFRSNHLDMVHKVLEIIMDYHCTAIRIFWSIYRLIDNGDVEMKHWSDAWDWQYYCWINDDGSMFSETPKRGISYKSNVITQMIKF